MEYTFLEGRSVVVVYLALLGIVFLRAQATYWIGRGLGAGVHRSRLGDRLGDKLERAEGAINRYGPPAVTVSFLTIGVQTAINLTAGAMRMRFVRYLIAMFAGCLMWAAIYTFGGLAVMTAWVSMFTQSPLLAVGALAAIAGLIGIIVWRRKQRAVAAHEV
ncbi:DedA family protein [Hoyosella altamirensis]|uniref:Membrane protein DedA with SNARE-associated domain n=1 Tax=Hoyosella altamirensis TaxID=616997 RepID=A0A839RK37_9ACTN|nr:VTT domain-containing protein [Hoyosella altamirensis]MBB3036486.1 membrane protein DedA with SNARE-associated domain [Hoyosella altamirensis]